MSMMEQLISRYYTGEDLKDWEQENQIIQENLARAKKCMTNQLWDKLYAAGFTMRISCSCIATI